MLKKFIAENELEELLTKASNNDAAFKNFIAYFLKSAPFIPSAYEVMPDGAGMAPLFFKKNEVWMLGVFTSLSRAKLFGDEAPFCLSMNGRELLLRLPSDTGLVVNPGFENGFEIMPDGLRRIRSMDYWG